jgi:phosphoglycerate dehydrogenase-like enzyme
VTRVAMLAPLGPEFVLARFPEADVATATSQAEAVEAATGADVCVVDWRGEVVVDDAVAAALAPTCRLVQVPAAGVNGVDLDACRRHGLPVASCAGLNTAAVADWCVWAMLDALRRLSTSERALRAGEWQMFGPVRHELAGRTVGIVGLGAIGTALAERLAGFGVELRYWSRRRREPAEEQRLAIRYEELDELVAHAEVLVLTVALTDETRGLLSAARIARLPHGAVVVNAARGEVADAAALAAAVDEGRLHGAATDVYAVEPPPDDHPLLGRDDVVATPHVAGMTVESSGRILQRVYDNIAAVQDGREPEGLLA